MLSFFTLKILATASLIQSSNASAFFLFYNFVIKRFNNTKTNCSKLSVGWVDPRFGLGWVGNGFDVFVFRGLVGSWI